jgi:DNA-binding MarR family transcriptional regulator
MLISALITGKKTFRELKEITGATDGNISVQITNLEKAGFITVTKSYVGRKPQTTAEITPEGVASFKAYIDLLNSVIQQYEERKN